MFMPCGTPTAGMVWPCSSDPLPNMPAVAVSAKAVPTRVSTKSTGVFDEIGDTRTINPNIKVKLRSMKVFMGAKLERFMLLYKIFSSKI